MLTDGLGGILFPMEAGGPMCGICRVDEWADGHEYSIDGWAEVVGYYVDGCTKVGGYQIDGYAEGTCHHIHEWAQIYTILDGWAGQGYIVSHTRVGPDIYYLRWVGRVSRKVGIR